MILLFAIYKWKLKSMDDDSMSPGPFVIDFKD